MKLAIIGAGVAGLVSLKYALESGHECDTFEQTDELGGTWVYTEKHGIDQYGLQICRSMYKGLRTNIPKELMEFLDFSYPSNIEESFISQPEVLQYLKDYAKKFELEKHIQYHKCVTKVAPQRTKWIVSVFDVKTKSEESKCYDAVFVCNGHFFHPRLPQIKGHDIFKGHQLHSRDYRTPDLYKNKRVLIIGASFSGMDIASLVSKVTNYVCLTHWKPITIKVPNVIIKPSIKHFYEHGAVFDDGTVDNFDIVIYCTGYKYVYPFLTNECGVIVEDNWVRNLYQHVINIENTSLCFIGIPFLVLPFPSCDIQARFALAAIERKFELPPKEIMKNEINDYKEKLISENIPQRHFHRIGINQGEYFANLAKMAGIKPIPPVISNIHKQRLLRWIKEAELVTVKRYVIIDDERFIEIL